MSTEPSLSHDEAIGQFCGVTGADEERARGLLEACEWNLELAINMHVDTDPDGRSSNRKASTSAAGTSSNNHHGNMNDDDGQSLNMGGHGRPPSYNSSNRDRSDHFGFANRASSSAPSASTSAYHDDNDTFVRPPIAPVRQILNPNPIGYPATEMPQRRYGTRIGPVSEVYDAFRDFQAEADWQEDGAESSVSDSSTNNSTKKSTNLQDLYRPPLSIMFRGTLTSARECGTLKNKWLLINIQNGREFACHLLNREVWSNQAVKDVVKAHFIFWQAYHDGYEGQRYVQFYNVSKFPHVAIIDPRTGEQMKSWPTTIDHNSFCDSVIEYLADHPSPDGSSDANSMKKLRVKEDGEEQGVEDDGDVEIISTRATLYDQSEEAQMEAAIKASLRESEKVAETNDDTIEIDDDDCDIDEESNGSFTTNTAATRVDPLHMEKTRLIQQIQREELEREMRRKKAIDQNARDRQAMKNKSKLAEISASQPPVESNPPPSTSSSNVAPSNNVVEREIPPGQCCRIALRYPDGSSIVQKFATYEPLEAVKLFVQSQKEAARNNCVEFVAPPNRKLNGSMMSQTLESLGLCPASRLEVKYNQDA